MLTVVLVSALSAGGRRRCAAMMAEAGLMSDAKVGDDLTTLEPVAVDPIMIEASDALIIPSKLITPAAAANAGKSSPRRNAGAKAVGDWTERTALSVSKTRSSAAATGSIGPPGARRRAGTLIVSTPRACCSGSRSRVRSAPPLPAWS
jgi:hypothetical protein